MKKSNKGSTNDGFFVVMTILIAIVSATACVTWSSTRQNLRDEIVDARVGIYVIDPISGESKFVVKCQQECCKDK